MENIEEVIAKLKAEVAQQRTIINKLLRTCLEAQTSEEYGTELGLRERETGITFDKDSRERLNSLYERVGGAELREEGDGEWGGLW